MGKSGSWKAAARWVAFALALGLFLRSIAAADLSRIGGIVGEAGPWLALAWLPFAAAVAVDSLAWKQLLGALGRDVPHAALVRVRLIGEAVSMSLPGGVVFAESLTPTLLGRHGVDASESVAAMAGKKWLTMRSHGLYVIASVALGASLLSRISRGVIHARGLPLLVLAGALLPLTLSVVLAASLRGSLAARVHSLLGRVPIQSLRAWLASRRDGFARTDAAFATIADDGGATRRATALYVTAWMIESVETLVILRALGADVGFVDALSIEAGLSVLRSIAFFAPAGIGVQDVGYVAYLEALGLPEATALGAAFVLVKRAKELTWIGVGYALLALGSARARRDSTATPRWASIRPAPALDLDA